MLYLEYFMADKHYVAWFYVLLAFYCVISFAYFLSCLDYPKEKAKNAKLVYLKIGPAIFCSIFVVLNLVFMDEFYHVKTYDVETETTVKGSIYYTSYGSDGSVVNKIISSDGAPKICDIKFNSYDFDDVELMDKEFVPPQNQKYYIVHDLGLNNIKCDGVNISEVRFPRLIVTEKQKKELLAKQESVLKDLEKNHETIMLNRIKSAKNEGKVFLD